MKNEINAQIDSTMKFVKKHQTLIAYGVGVAVGIGGMVVARNHKAIPLIAITANNAKMMKEGCGILYETKYGDIVTSILAERPPNLT